MMQEINQEIGKEISQGINDNVGNELPINQKEVDIRLGFFGKIKYILVKPSEFFELIKEEDNAWKSIVFLLIIQAIAAPLFIIVKSTVNQTIESLSLLDILVGTLGGFSISLALIPIYHSLLCLFGSRNSIKKTTQSVMYGTLPSVILGWIPIVNFIGVIWSIYPTIIGFKKLHKISIFKAIIIFLLPFLIISLVSAISTVRQILANQII